MKYIFLLFIFFTINIFAADTVIVPKNSGNAFLQDVGGNLLPLNISYTTDGAGHLKLINSSNPVDDDIVVPKDSGKAFLNGADGNLYPVQVIYTTDGNGNVIPVPAGGGGGSGTVTSVGLALPSIFSVSGSPVTTSGTLTGSLANESANLVFSGPTTGSAAAPTFRNLVAADIPSLAYVSSVTGTAPIVSSGGLTPALSCQVASGSQAGCLASADWTTFNSKQPAGSYITALTGDVSASGPGSVASTISTPAHDVYVNYSASVGNDTTGTGSILRPWRTIQHACNSISPSINFPIVIHLNGGNNDSDTGTITCPPNIELVADYQIQVAVPFTISGGSTNDGFSASNITFSGAFTWIRNDANLLSMGANNAQFNSGPTFKQTGTGWASFTCNNCVTVNADFKTGATGSFFNNASFLGTTTFEDATSSAYYQIQAGYVGGAMTINGAPTVYFSGVQFDQPFGATLTTVTTANGSPTIQSDDGSIPSSITGTYTLAARSFSQYEDFTKGAKMGAVGASSASNVLFEVKDGHQKSSQTTAPTATVNANAGTGATCSVSNATDSAGKITIVSGSSGTPVAGDQCTINFNKTYSVAPVCVIYPANSNAGSNLVQSYIDNATETTSALPIAFNVAAGTSTTYIYNYYCIETQ